MTNHNDQALLEQKRALRDALLKRRNALGTNERQAYSDAIVARLLVYPDITRATRVMAYASMESEVQTAELLSVLLSRGQQLVLPRVNRGSRQLDLYLVKDLSRDLIAGTWGIMEPDPERCEYLTDTRTIDAVIVPGVAFTAAGLRMGYGGGYYDKLLGGWQGGRCFIAPAFEEQLVERLPAGALDVRMHCIVTPGRNLVSETK